MLSITDIYKINIYDRYHDLKKLNKNDYDNYELAKIFEYYTCIQLFEEYNKIFYEYSDINPTFKEDNNMSQTDTGIDCCDLDNTIVQCKLRSNCLGWSECGTFFGSQNMYDAKQKKIIVRWENMILARNDCQISNHLVERKNNNMFYDKVYNKMVLLQYCEELSISKLYNKPIDFTLRDYQKECIDLVYNTENIIISLPTGTGKAKIIVHALHKNTKYLILVPRIILMEQLKEEIILHNNDLRLKIQCIGDGNDIYDESKDITICIFNSINIIEKYVDQYNKIFIDEAHHIYKPAIYSSDDIINNKGYIEKIKKLSIYKNNVCLSATIDKMNNFVYYHKDIREMIDTNYLCDYIITIPIFSNIVSDTDVCKNLIENYRNIIIYCSTQSNGVEVNRLMNEWLPGCSKYIDCYTTKKERNIILQEYKDGTLPFLVNVKVLVEGFDAPITKGVCFMHLPKNKTALIQIIGRALRKHPTKLIANIILPFSTDNDEHDICKFLKILAMNDSRICKSYKNKKLGGYINIKYAEQIDNTSEFRYNKIYNSVGILINIKDEWITRLDECQVYFDKYNRRPNSNNEDKYIKLLGEWLTHQIRTSKTGWNNERQELWNSFYNKNYDIIDRWYIMLSKVIEYIQRTGLKPCSCEIDHEVGLLGNWLNNNLTKASKANKWDDHKKATWNEFTKNYSKFCIKKDDMWFIKLEKVKTFFIDNGCRPRSNANDISQFDMNAWLNEQVKKYNTLDKWDKRKIQAIEGLINMYPESFKSDEEIWIDTLNKVDNFMTMNNKKPLDMTQWIHYQMNGKEDKNWTPKTLLLWKEFYDKHKPLLVTAVEFWINRLEEIITYIKLHNNRPFYTENRILARWLCNQKTSYKNPSNKWVPEQKDRWRAFIKEYGKFL